MSRHVNGYELLREIGLGSFSKVFLARNIHNGRHFAIKEIRRNLHVKVTGSSTQQLACIESEISTLEKVHHENIIEYYEGFRCEGTRYLVFEYCKRGDLQQFLEKHRKKLA